MAEVNETPTEAPSAPEVTPVADTTPSVEEVMRFDPFAEGNEPKSQQEADPPKTETPPKKVETKSKAEASPKPGDGGKVEAPSATPPAQPPAKAETPTPDPLSELKARVAAQDATIAELRRAHVAPAKPETPQDDGLSKLYSFSMPPQLQAALRSDDDAVFAQGMSALMSAHAIAIHRNVVQQLQREMQQFVPQMIQRTSAEDRGRSAIEQDFYGAYPHFNKKELRPIVQQTAVQVAQELGATQWSPTLRDAVALRVTNFLAGLTGVVTPPTPPPPPAPPPTRRFSVNGAPPRPASTTPDPNSPVDIGKVLGF